MMRSYRVRVARVFFANPFQTDELRHEADRLSVFSIFDRIVQTLETLHMRTSQTSFRAATYLLAYVSRGFCRARERTHGELYEEMLEDFSFLYRIGYAYESEALMWTAWRSPNLDITLRLLMTLDDDDILESSISVYIDSFLIDTLRECLAQCITDSSHSTQPIIESLHLVDMSDESFPVLQVGLVFLDP